LSVISVISETKGKDPRHLADDAGFVDHRLAGDDLVLLALVDDHLAREGIACRVQDLRNRPLPSAAP
jgi:hypothetical protein